MREQYSERRGGFFQYVLVLAVVVAAFWTGTLYKELELRRSGVVGSAKVAGTQVGGDTLEPEVEEPVVLSDDQWKKLLDNPVAEVGEQKAKVVMVEFTDYQCPFCKRAFTDTWPQIKKDYVDAGKLRVVYRDLPLSFHPNAKPAALAARCAGAQKRYLDMHDKLFETQEEWSSLADPKEKFAEYAGALGLNSAKFSTCYSENTFGDEIEADLALANTVGATGTPTFFVNGKQIVGAQPVATFKDAIDGALK